MSAESFVIDANIINALQRSLTGHKCEASAEAEPVFEHLAQSRRRILLDNGGHIQNEWEACVDHDWFTNWFMDFVSAANVVSIDVKKEQTLEKKLHSDLGFPRRENMWLVRTAAAEARSSGECNLLTEDMDFRDPKMKKATAARRQAYITGSKLGPVTKVLKKEKILVLALCMYEA